MEAQYKIYNSEFQQIKNTIRHTDLMHEEQLIENISKIIRK